MAGNVTVKDIARIAGVSIGTVDRVLHDRGRVAEATADRVRKAVEETGFTLNLHASNLAQAREYRIGVLAPLEQQDSGFWRLPVSGIREAAGDLAPFRIRLLIHEFDRTDTASFFQAAQELLAEAPDGILLAPVLTEAAEEFCSTLKTGFPVCCFDTELPGGNTIGYIGQDSYASGVVAGKLMNVRIPKDGRAALLQSVRDDYHITERIRGFLSVLPGSLLVKTYDLDAYELRQKIEEILLQGAAGIFVTNASVHETAAILQALGREDVPLIGYDVIEENRKLLEAGAIDVLLSQRPRLQGSRGLQRLFRYIHGQEHDPIREIMPIDILIAENMTYYQDF